MLYQFVAANRAELIRRSRAKVATRPAPRPTAAELESGVPLFLDQLVETLRLSTATTEAITASAARHGGALLRKGFTVAQVVHDYGDICQAITGLAEEHKIPITVAEFHTLNRCLDDAIAEAVTEFMRLREASQNESEAERRGFFIHELRNKVGALMLAYDALKSGRVGFGGSTATVVERNMRGLNDLIDRSFTAARVEAGVQHLEPIGVAELVEEIEIDALLGAKDHNLHLTVGPVESGLVVTGDRAVVTAAVANLLQNAFKFSLPNGHVSLMTSATGQQVQFDVTDTCGGLPQGSADDLFRPYTQRGENRKGLGLGLAICRKGIEASGGEVRVLDIPGTGCTFSIILPRQT